MKTLLTLAALTLTAAPVLAGEILLEKPMAGATLHQAGIDMSVYWTEQDKGYEVVATFVPELSDVPPARMVMLLADGDDVTFGLPGTLSHSYTFARTDQGVSVRSDKVGLIYASN